MWRSHLSEVAQWCHLPMSEEMQLKNIIAAFSCLLPVVFAASVNVGRGQVKKTILELFLRLKLVVLWRLSAGKVFVSWAIIKYLH